MSNNAHELSKRLLNALDNSYNVVDMHAVNEIISILEKINITKELLETTRLGKHVNELRRKTSDPALARRAKVLVKRWRDLVIPTATNSPAHTGLPGSNRSSAERTLRRLGGTPLTSPALSRQVVSPAVPSPKPQSRPAWGGYESDSQDVILVDDDPPPVTPVKTDLASVKRPNSPIPVNDDKKAKRDKKPKKKRAHSRAGTDSTWAGLNGAPRNGCAVDAYSALVNRMPPRGAKKVKTTKELLEDIQSRGGSKPISLPPSPGSPDVMLIEPDPVPVKSESPLRNGDSSPRPPSPPAPRPLSPLEDPRSYPECGCGSGGPCGWALAPPTPLAVAALHHALRPGVNGTRAPAAPRPAPRPATADGLFTSVVPLYKYTDYADDYVVKNMARVPLCEHLPWTEWAPPPPDIPPPPSPPPLRPFPPTEEPSEGEIKVEIKEEVEDRLSPELPLEEESKPDAPTIEDRLKPEDESMEVSPKPESPTIEGLKRERTPSPEPVPKREAPSGRELLSACRVALAAAPYVYAQTGGARELAAEEDPRALLRDPSPPRDPLGRPPPPPKFAEWHEPAQLGDLVALPYVVID